MDNVLLERLIAKLDEIAQQVARIADLMELEESEEEEELE